jgi:hypothetical protein
MSDGPFRSLPMSPRWKKVAEFANNSAASRDDISLAVESAIQQEWKRDVPPDLIEKIKEEISQPNLFGEPDFEKLRRIATGKPIANSILNYLNNIGYSDTPSNEILINAITQSIVERSARALRQIQEHCIRRAEADRSFMVGGRITQALREIGYDKLAQKLLDPKAMESSKKMFKKTGLDDGVKI